MTNVLLCIGNNMMGGNDAGSLLAEKYVAAPKGNWVVIDGSSAPENGVVVIRELRLTRPLIVGATDMGLNPGEICIIGPTDTAEMFMITARNMPLGYLIDQLKENTGEVTFLGIQSDIVDFYYPMTQPIRDAMETVYQRLEDQKGNGGFVQLAAEEGQFSSKEFKELNIRAGMCAFLLSLVLPARAANFTEYLLISGSGYMQKRTLRPPLTMPCGTDQNWRFKEVDVTDVTLERVPNEDDYWRLTAKDRASKSWFVPVGVLRNMAGNAQLYRAGLDHNGIQGLVIWRDVSGNGLAPSSFLILMTFSQQGRLCVFQVGGFYTANETDVDDLLDLQGNGHT